MADLNIHFNIRVTTGVFRWGLTALLLSVFAAELSTESVTLSTYYPAPSGVYTQMITTSNTYLARDGGSVGIGTTSPSERLDVGGGNIKMGWERIWNSCSADYCQASCSPGKYATGGSCYLTGAWTHLESWADDTAYACTKPPGTPTTTIYAQVY